MLPDDIQTWLHYFCFFSFISPILRQCTLTTKKDHIHVVVVVVGDDDDDKDDDDDECDATFYASPLYSSLIFYFIRHSEDVISVIAIDFNQRPYLMDTFRSQKGFISSQCLRKYTFVMCDQYSHTVKVINHCLMINRFCVSH